MISSHAYSSQKSTSIPAQAYVLIDHTPSREEEEGFRTKKELIESGVIEGKKRERGKVGGQPASPSSSESKLDPPNKLSSLQQTLDLFAKTQELAKVSQKEHIVQKNLPGMYLRLRDRSMREGYSKSPMWSTVAFVYRSPPSLTNLSLLLRCVLLYVPGAGLDVGSQIVIGGTEITVRDIELIEQEIRVQDGRRSTRKKTFMVSKMEPYSIDTLLMSSNNCDSFMEYTLNKYGRRPEDVFESSERDKEKTEDTLSPSTIDLDLGDDVIQVEVTEEDEEDEEGGHDKEPQRRQKEDKKYGSGGGTPSSTMKKSHHRAVSRIYSDVLRPHSSFRRVGSILKKRRDSAVSPRSTRDASCFQIMFFLNLSYRNTLVPLVCNV